MKLPARGPWFHGYFETPSETLAVSFRDTAGRDWTVQTHHKVTGAGPPLILVHGLMTTSYSWRFVIAELARHYRVYVPDLVGAGETDKPTDLVYSVANVGRYLAAYVRAIGAAPAYVVGNSLGGLHSANAIFNDPAIARRFILIHSPGYPSLRTRFAGPALKVVGWALPGLLRRMPRFVVSRNVHYGRADMLSEEEVTEYAKLFATREGCRAFVRILKESLSLEEHGAFMAALRAKRPFPVPALCLFSRKDVLVPPEFGPLWAADLGAPLHWIEDASHFIHVDQPRKVVEEILAFDEVPSSSDRSPA